uniref:Putative ATPase domain containing protein n=1 Tax=viral metagenome TaxID=1070528 RepID=A0A6M3JS68_9ZZZZ
MRERILDLAQSTSELGVSDNYLIKALLAGHSGTGKTQGSITLPRTEGKLLLHLNYDGRKETLAGEEGIVSIDLYESDPESPKAWDRGEEVRKELWALVHREKIDENGVIENPFPYSGVIEDGLSMMARTAMNSALLTDNQRGLGGSPARQHYNPQIHYLVKHINSMRALPCHYVLCAHFDMISTEDEGGGLKMTPKITRSLRTEVPAWFNETYRTYRESVKGKTHYFWSTHGDGLYEFFKSTLNNKGKYWNSPVRIDFENPPVGFERLLQYRFGQLKQDEENQPPEKGTVKP